jgi:hypothetical protein
MEQKRMRIVNRELLEEVRNLVCLACASLDVAAAREAMYDNQVRSHPHHVISRGSGGGDVASNLLPLCLQHHTEIHKVGNTEFAQKYAVVKNWMISTGHLEE